MSHFHTKTHINDKFRSRFETACEKVEFFLMNQDILDYKKFSMVVLRIYDIYMPS